MSSQIPIDVMRSAFPLGYLPRKGSITRGGWMIGTVDLDKDLVGVISPQGRPGLLLAQIPGAPPSLWASTGKSARWLDSKEDPNEILAALELGDLLPVLDSTKDPGSWACVLVEMAEVAGLQLAPGELPMLEWNPSLEMWKVVASSTRKGAVVIREARAMTDLGLCADDPVAAVVTFFSGTSGPKARN